MPILTKSSSGTVTGLWGSAFIRLPSGKLKALAVGDQLKQGDQVVDVPYSAVQYVRHQLGLQVCAIARLNDLMQYLEAHSSQGLAADHQRVLAYRQRYGVNEGTSA